VRQSGSVHEATALARTTEALDALEFVHPLRRRVHRPPALLERILRAGWPELPDAWRTAPDGRSTEYDAQGGER
jgi:hypothetical protein